MAQIISIINNKGGVGKTSTSATIGELLAFLGKRVLLVDMDPQSNLSMLYGLYYDDSEDKDTPAHKNISELFTERYRTSEEVQSVIYHTSQSNLDMIPASHRHYKTADQIKLKITANNSVVLKRALDTIQTKYDYIIIDNAPANDIMTINSMMASDLVIVPVRTDAFSYEGVKYIIQDIYEIKNEYQIDKLSFGGVFFVEAEPNTNNYKEWRRKYEEELNEYLMNTAIRKDVKIKECLSYYIPILKYASGGNAVFDYAQLLLELHILDEDTAAILQSGFTE